MRGTHTQTQRRLPLMAATLEDLVAVDGLTGAKVPSIPASPSDDCWHTVALRLPGPNLTHTRTYTITQGIHALDGGARAHRGAVLQQRHSVHAVPEGGGGRSEGAFWLTRRLRAQRAGTLG